MFSVFESKISLQLETNREFTVNSVFLGNIVVFTQRGKKELIGHF